MSSITLTINGIKVTSKVDGSVRLLDFIRDHMKLTGSKEGCAVGECGACTVILNGEAVCSCLVLVAQCDGAVITTIEGVDEDLVVNKLQVAFVDTGGVQCGFCTPGVLMSVKALLDKVPQPSETQILDALEGNLCRCTGYQPIINAINQVIKS